MSAKLERNAAQYEQPEHNHQRKIESAEACCVQRWKREKERAARGNQPHLVGVPYWPNRARHEPAFLFAVRDEELHDARAHIESIEQVIERQHQCNMAIPNGYHLRFSSVF